MSSKQFMRYSEFAGKEAPFQDHVDMRYDPGEDGRPRMVLDIQPNHLNTGKVLHGGMVMTLLDVAMSASCNASDPQRRATVTIELKVNFLRPGGCNGDRVIASGNVRHITRSFAFCDGELRKAANGELLATGSGTFKFVSPSRSAGD